MEMKKREEKEHKAHQEVAVARANKKWEKKREAAVASRAVFPRRKTEKKEERSNTDDAGSEVP